MNTNIWVTASDLDQLRDRQVLVFSGADCGKTQLHLDDVPYERVSMDYPTVVLTPDALDEIAATPQGVVIENLLNTWTRTVRMVPA